MFPLRLRKGARGMLATTAAAAAHPLPVHPLRLAPLAASPYVGTKGTEIPRYARNDMGIVV